MQHFKPPALPVVLDCDCCIEAIYENYRGEVSKRVLEPYSLVAKSSLWYLVAKESDKSGDELRTFRVSRFHKLRRLDTYFQRDQEFDLATYWHNHLDEFTATFAEYEFTLRIHPDRVTFARWLTPGRNRILDTDTDEWVTLHFQIENVELAKMLVFGLGTQCEVIAPLALREAVIVTCATLIDHL